MVLPLIDVFIGASLTSLKDVMGCYVLTVHAFSSRLSLYNGITYVIECVHMCGEGGTCGLKPAMRELWTQRLKKNVVGMQNHNK